MGRPYQTLPQPAMHFFENLRQRDRDYEDLHEEYEGRRPRHAKKLCGVGTCLERRRTSTVVVAAGTHCVTGTHSIVVVLDITTLPDRAACCKRSVMHTCRTQNGWGEPLGKERLQSGISGMWCSGPTIALPISSELVQTVARKLII
jgi:hypothetical protein